MFSSFLIYLFICLFYLYTFKKFESHNTQSWCTWRMLTEFWWIGGEPLKFTPTTCSRGDRGTGTKGGIQTQINSNLRLVSLPVSTIYSHFAPCFISKRCHSVWDGGTGVAAYLMPDSRGGHHGGLCECPLPPLDAGLQPSKIKKNTKRVTERLVKWGVL